MLDNKVILITGALGKLGKASMQLFLEKGAFVAATDRLSFKDHPVASSLLEQYGAEKLLLQQADVCDEQQVAQLAKLIQVRFGRLDGSFHNAYAQLHRPLVEYALEEWENVVRGTLTSAFLVCKHSVKLMAQTGGGAIVNTSSILGERPQASCSAYGAAKAGLNQLTRVLALENAANGIRANCIVPGDFKETGRERTPEEKEALRRAILLGRSGTPREIAQLAAFLLSDDASYITGAMYTIDGGYRL